MERLIGKLICSAASRRNRGCREEAAQRFLDAVMREARGRGLLADDHFTADGPC